MKSASFCAFVFIDTFYSSSQDFNSLLLNFIQFSVFISVFAFLSVFRFAFCILSLTIFPASDILFPLCRPLG